MHHSGDSFSYTMKNLFSNSKSIVVFRRMICMHKIDFIINIVTLFFLLQKNKKKKAVQFKQYSEIQVII